MPPSLVRLANDLLPPALLRLWRRVRRPRYGFFGSYDSYAAAEAAAESGYSDVTLVNAIVRRQRELVAAPPPLELDDRWRQLQLAVALAGGSEGDLRVLDFGGAAGTHYFDVVRWRERTGWPRGRLRWHVCETAAMVAAATPDFAGEELSFHASLEELEGGGYDLVYANSSLQYVSDSTATWDRLAALPHGWLMIDRTPFIAAPTDVFAVQRIATLDGRPASYAGRFLAESAWLRRIDRTHDLIVRWPDRGPSTWVEGRRDVRYGGMLLKRR